VYEPTVAVTPSESDAVTVMREDVSVEKPEKVTSF
jgi:hypothetical protein